MSGPCSRRRNACHRRRWRPSAVNGKSGSPRGRPHDPRFDAATVNWLHHRMAPSSQPGDLAFARQTLRHRRVRDASRHWRSSTAETATYPPIAFAAGSRRITCMPSSSGTLVAVGLYGTGVATSSIAARTGRRIVSWDTNRMMQPVVRGAVEATATSVPLDWHPRDADGSLPRRRCGGDVAVSASTMQCGRRPELFCDVESALGKRQIAGCELAAWRWF